MQMIKAGVIGASGYAGNEVLRLLLMHPEVQVTGVGARSYLGQKVSDLYPSFYQVCDLVFETDDEVIADADIVFAGLPAGISEKYAAKCHQLGKKFIDLGADFRLKNEADYAKWYGKGFDYPELHKEAVYGLPELHREEIKKASIIGNPGCYPTTINLGLYPLLKNHMNASTKIIADSASGTTGAGKKLTEDTHFTKTNESYHAYKAGNHRHTPEIEQELSLSANEDMHLTFVPHLLPVNRGIVSTIYVTVKEELSLAEIHQAYAKQYENEQFVRVLPLGKNADLKFVQYTNYCDISLAMDERDHTLIICSTIDNMVKGTAGQAIQNMNLMFGLKENTGLQFVGPSF